MVVAGTLVYSSTLDYTGFRFDGQLFIVNNPLIKDLDYYTKLVNISKFSLLDEQLGLVSDVTTNFMMRPVSYLTFTFNYLLGELNPFSYRLVNIIIHIINTLLVYACVDRLLNFTPSINELSRFSARFIPTVSAFIFLLHPMQTESVTYITQRFASLAALFYLSTMYSYLLWCWQQQQGIIKHNQTRWLSLILLFLGMFTRESLFTAPLMILLLEVTVLDNTITAGFKRAKLHIAMLPIIPIMVFMVSAAQNNTSPSLSGAINVVNYVETPILHYALTQLVVVLNYLCLYLFPVGQSVEHEQTLYTVLHQLPVVSSLIIILLMVVGAYYFYRKNQDDKRHALIFVGICWYFLGLAVSSSVIPLPDLMVEHRAYFPAIGFIFALICLLDILRTNIGSTKSNNIMVALIAIWCVILIVLTYNRNKVWESGIMLWSNAVKHSPNSHRSNYNLGVAFIYAKNYHEAIKYLNKSIEIDPNWAQAYEVLAIALIELKRYHEAATVSIKGIDVNPASPVFYNNLGIAYAETGRMADAKQAFSTALALQPGYINAINNLDSVESYFESSIGSRKK